MAKVGTMKKAHKKIKNLEGVQRAEMLTGQYDIMALAEADSLSEITDTLIEKIRSLSEVENTVTNVFITP
ncbi:MAG: Lrp/AsnC ligand binding domain-containing protein [Candidatus Hadarchaeota archaeon]